VKLIKEIDIRRVGKSGNKLRWGLFECPFCGQAVERCKSNGLKQKSCGCFVYKKHGMAKTRFYRIWEDMKKRCNNPQSKHFNRYGGRGIKYDEKWEKFEGFKSDMFESYSNDLTLDRIDNDGNYNKENCQWIPGPENAGKNHRGRKQSEEQIRKRVESRRKNIANRIGC
jgi:hypothetical protein